jgi:thioredoxin-like negative regulator of GroEL
MMEEMAKHFKVI